MSVQLNCLLSGLSREDIVQVQVEPGYTIARLRAAICDQLRAQAQARGGRDHLEGTSEIDLQLIGVSLPFDELDKAARPFEIPGALVWEHYLDRVGASFEGVRDDCVHVVVVRPETVADRDEGRREMSRRRKHEEEEDDFPELTKRLKRTLSVPEKFTPSEGSKPSNYSAIQDGDAPILDGRYRNRTNDLALPVEVYHPVFARFRARAADPALVIPDDMLGLTTELMRKASRISIGEPESESRTEGMRVLLTEILCFTVVRLGYGNQGWLSPSYVAALPRTEQPLGCAAVVFLEETHEIGQDGDGTTKGGLAYLRHWSDRNQGGLRERLFCPSFIVSIAGPWIAVLGAVLTTNAIVHRLTDYIWIGESRVLDDANTFRIARVLTALRQSVDDLTTFYESEISMSSNPSRFFPRATSYYDDKRGQKVAFAYLGGLVRYRCAAFMAVVPEERRFIVVKFVERYGVEAHRLLEGKGLAPALLYYGDIWHDDPLAQAGCGTRKMVVMEHVEGRVCVDGVAEGEREVVKEAVRCLHEAGFVHGDIRGQNVLVVGGEGGAKAGSVKLLDFDWAGREGEVRYPLRLSKDLRWPSGVRDNGLILAEYDNEMVDWL
ncbi:protein kinase subdomain-containing protein PKL/ccin9 [Coprinopsis cinerea AmutBmut pab1-1]|nr:protein kinase subdomain-containing protein PKL/ccin9 [Coprinopsis cinerea AmutBmut pab1-1]